MKLSGSFLKKKDHFSCDQNHNTHPVLIKAVCFFHTEQMTRVGLGRQGVGVGGYKEQRSLRLSTSCSGLHFIIF